MIQYPAGLPVPTREGYDFSQVDAKVRTPMETGRARQRRKYQSVPSMVSASWIFTAAQAQLFEAWFEEVLLSGSEWFECPLSTPQGLLNYRARFVGTYDGPAPLAHLWRIRATLELFEKPVLRGGWAAILPGYILNADILDKAANREWPEQYPELRANYAEIDSAINKDWPEA